MSLAQIRYNDTSSSLNSDILDAIRYSLYTGIDYGLKSEPVTFQYDGNTWRFYHPGLVANEPIKIEKRPCDHSWKLYEGFTAKYNYCEKCDLKKQL